MHKVLSFSLCIRTNSYSLSNPFFPSRLFYFSCPLFVPSPRLHHVSNSLGIHTFIVNFFFYHPILLYCEVAVTSTVLKYLCTFTLCWLHEIRYHLHWTMIKVPCNVRFVTHSCSIMKLIQTDRHNLVVQRYNSHIHTHVNWLLLRFVSGVVGVNRWTTILTVTAINTFTLLLFQNHWNVINQHLEKSNYR